MTKEQRLNEKASALLSILTNIVSKDGFNTSTDNKNKALELISYINEEQKGKIIITCHKARQIDIDNIRVVVKVEDEKRICELDFQYNIASNTAHYSDSDGAEEYLLKHFGIEIDTLIDGIETRKYRIN